MDPTKLQKESLKRAAGAPGNIIAGLASTLVSVATVNPLPLILYGLGASIWVLRAAISGRYTKEILQEEEKHKESHAQSERQVLERELQLLFETGTLSALVSNRAVPDYYERYLILNSMREQIVRHARDNRDVGATLEDDIVKQVDYMLTAFLRLARSRLLHLQVLMGVYLDRVASDKRRRNRPRWTRVFLKPTEEEEAEETENEREFIYQQRTPGAAESGERRISNLQKEHIRLMKLAEEEPSAAKVHKTHATLIAKQIELLRDCSERSKRVAAQLDAFVSAFQYILDRLRSSQFEAGEVTSFMSNLVDQVDETVKFAEVIRPGLDELFMGFHTVTAMQ